MARSLSASIRKPGSKCTRLCAFTIIVEIPDDMDEREQINALNALERHGIERQALETVLWHLRERSTLKRATARMEQ